MSPRMLLVVRLWPWVLALAVMLPVLAPGYVLSYDMVFVPDLALRPDFLGLGSGLPRAIPSDAVVALLDEVLPGMLLQKIVLVGSLVLAGSGVRRLVAADSAVAQLAAISLFVWNPFVAERLVMGHWTVLLGYAALPWLVDALRRSRATDRPSAGVVGWLVLGALGASSGVMTLVVLLAFGVTAGRAAGRRTVLLLLTWLAVNAPWIVAGLLHSDVALSDPLGARVFAAHGEVALPAGLAVLGLGGIWNLEVVPASRLGFLAWAALGVTLAGCALGFNRWRRAVGGRDAAAAGAVAVVGLGLATAGLLAPDAVAWLVGHVPGFGLIRDGTRYLGLLALVEAWIFGYGAARLAELPSDRTARTALAAGAVLVPVALMPDLGWGAAGRLVPVQYPPSYAAAREAVTDARADGVPGDVLVLPFTTYRAPAWNGGRKVLDPLGRYVTPDYLASDDLQVSGRAVRGEDPRARRARELLVTGTPESRARGLGRLGIGLVLTDGSAPGANSNLAGPVAGRMLHRAGSLTVTAIENPTVAASPRARAAALALAWLVYLGAVGWGLAGVARRVFRLFSPRG